MVARARSVGLSTGQELRTPLLVPSISSAGFPLRLIENEERPEPYLWLQVLGPLPANRALLVSAYDLHHGNLPQQAALCETFAGGLYDSGGPLFVDSGLYEAEIGPPPATLSGARQPWDAELFHQTVDSLDSESAAILVNFDSYEEGDYRAFADQIDEGLSFFSAYPAFGSDFLLKPERRNTPLQVSELDRELLERLRVCDIVGVAEKDLGSSLNRRLSNLTELRERLDAAGVQAPIHLFGSLDPVLSPLYHAAGAEIFDGLTWLRYGYDRGAGIYLPQVPVLREDLHPGLEGAQRDLRLFAGNLATLDALEQSMRSFANNRNWSVFDGGVEAQLRSTHNTMGE